MKRIFSVTIVLLVANLAYTQINDAFKFKVSSPFNHTDETVLRFHQDATSSFDGLWDAWKMFTWNDSVPSLFSNTAEDGMLSINSIDFPMKDTSLILEMKVPVVSGTYTFETEALGQLPSHLTLAIKDLESGVSYQLQDGTSFDFNINADPQNMIERFELFVSREAYAVVDSSVATIYNEGCHDWNLTLLDESQAELFNQQLVQESISMDTLAAGLYTGIVTDAYGISDIISFEIISVEEDEEQEEDEEEGQEEEEVAEYEDKYENDMLSFDTAEKPEVQLVYEYGNAVLLATDTKITSVKVYSYNGALIDELTSYDGEKYMLDSYGVVTLLHVIHEQGEVVLKYSK